jgi:sigma-B regulation protein RsbU (phosphoserine phosphatase)
MVCRNGERLRIRVEGIPIGLLEDRQYDELVFQAEPGDLILLYSDGITDQTNRGNQEYGAGRLFQALKQVCVEPAKQVVQVIAADLEAYREHVPIGDDQTLIAIRVL